MKKVILSFSFVFAFLMILGLPAFAQRNVTPALDKDPILELDAKHNLDVAWHYFKLKKAYKAALMRFEETFAAYPQFSKMEEFLYIAGMSSYSLSQNKGKQKASDNKLNKYSPEKLREDAIAYFGLLLERNPQSQYKDEVDKVLKELKPVQ